MNVTKKINFDDVIRNWPAIFAAVANRKEVVIVEQEGKSIKLESTQQEPEVVSNPWVNYDPVKAKAALHASVGVLAHVDVDNLLSDLREQRRQDSSGRPAE